MYKDVQILRAQDAQEQPPLHPGAAFFDARGCVKTPKFFLADEKFPTSKNDMAENFRIFPPRLQKLGFKLTDCPTDAKKVAGKKRVFRMAPLLPRIRGFGTRAPQRDIPIAMGLAQTSCLRPIRALAQSRALRRRAIRSES